MLEMRRYTKAQWPHEGGPNDPSSRRRRLPYRYDGHIGVYMLEWAALAVNLGGIAGDQTLVPFYQLLKKWQESFLLHIKPSGLNYQE